MNENIHNDVSATVCYEARRNLNFALLDCFVVPPRKDVKMRVIERINILENHED